MFLFIKSVNLYFENDNKCFNVSCLRKSNICIFIYISVLYQSQKFNGTKSKLLLISRASNVGNFNKLSDTSNVSMVIFPEFDNFMNKQFHEFDNFMNR